MFGSVWHQLWRGAKLECLVPPQIRKLTCRVSPWLLIFTIIISIISSTRIAISISISSISN